MLAEHAQSNTLIFILKPTDNACFLKQPHGCTQNNRYTRKPGVHPPALGSSRKHIGCWHDTEEDGYAFSPD